MSANYKFRKSERLASRKEIDFLFSNGRSFFIHPFRVIWSTQPSGEYDFPAALAIAVPKKRFKRAVDRNRIKRLIREAYRLQKAGLYHALDQGNMHLNFILVYAANDILTYKEMTDKISAVLKRLSKEIDITG